MPDSENMGIAEVARQISKTDRLKPNFNSYDKVPSWDGEVYIYDKPNCDDKSNLKVVRVQVKSHRKNLKRPSNEIKYKVDRKDIENYKNNGGAVFFVVYYNTSQDIKSEIYYILISPIKANSLLADHFYEEEIKLRLNKFPNDAEKITYLFQNFYNDCQRQTSFVFEPAVSIFNKTSKRYRLFSHIDKYDNNLFKSIFSSEHHLYSLTQDSVLIPLKESICVKEIGCSPISKVRVGKECYYDNIDLIFRDDETITVSFGDCCIININMNNSTRKINFNLPQGAKHRYKALLFLKALVREKRISLDDYVFFDIKDDFIKKAKQIDLETQINYLKPIVDMLIMLNCSQDLNLSSLADEDLTHLEILINSFVKHKSQKLILKNEANKSFSSTRSVLTTLKVGDLKFLVIIYYDGQSHYICNPFSTTCYVELQQNKFTILSQINENDLISISNIPLDSIDKFYDNYGFIDSLNQEIKDTINNFIISYYISNKTRSDLIEAANKLSAYFMEKLHNKDDYMKIVHYHLVKISNKLSKEITEEIEDLIDMYQNDPTMLFALSLLKDDQRQAYRIFSNLSEQLQCKLKNNAIFMLYDTNSFNSIK